MKSVYKVFSFSTTIRNPQRNSVFLECLNKFNGLIFDSKNSRLYFEELVKNGIYKLSNIPSKINEKLINDDILSDLEFEELLKLNPQISSEEKINFRIRTQLKALESQGFLIFSGDKNKPIITMTNLAFELMSRKSYITDIYSKIMIGLHSHNPARKSTLNKARVFLNAIFVIDSLKKEWEKLGNEAKGILKYEFKSFVLGMKDCDYKKCVQDILEYRKNYGLKENEKYISDYLFNKLGLKKIKYDSLNDYADEVFRKFEMTGLLIARGKFKHIYYDFSNFNSKKIESLLNSETTSIARHMKESQDKRREYLRTILIAPYIHWDVALFFKFCAKEFESKIAPIKIAKFIELIEKSPNFSDFQINFDKFVNRLLNEQTQNYIDSINFN